MQLQNDDELAAFRSSGVFDENWYLEQYPDVKMLGMDPLQHFLWIGRRIGREPNATGLSPAAETVFDIASLPTDDYRRQISSRWISNTADIARNPIRPLAPLHKTFNPNSLNIHWVVQDFSIGSGGHMSIFRMVYWLEKFGHKQTIWLQNASRHQSEQHALNEIRRNFQPIQNVVVRFLDNDVEGISGDVVVATDMWTPFPVVNMPLFKERFYFVQDYEACFHSVGTYSHLADYTYRLGLKVVCAGEWLRALMADKFGLWARAWELAYDDEHYHAPSNKLTKTEILRRKPRVAFYARQLTSRRMVEFGKVAFDILHDRELNFHVEFFGQENLDIRGAYSYKNHGILTPEQLGKLYRNCDVGVVFSATNYSLIPMEMMACGLPVVELDTESTRAIFPSDSVEYACPSPTAIADAIERLLVDADRRETVRKGGQDFISDLSWEKSARALESALLEGLAETCAPVVPTKVVEQPKNYPFKASVIVPTWNGGEQFRNTLQAIIDQKTDWPFEMLVLDSGSTDATIDFVRGKEAEGVRLHTIPNEQFQHGRTRNLGLSLTSGEFVAILTQDAMPATDRWLGSLIAAFDSSPLIAGVFGSHKPYPDADPYTAENLSDHFEWHKRMPAVMDWYSDTPERRFGEVGWAQWLHYFSDNNAALRRSVWEVIPYPEIDWGEDQAWAWEIIKQGYKKAYAHDAAVYHSHNQTYEQTFAVSRIESEFFLRYFSYSYERTSKEVSNCIRGINARDYRRGRENGWSDEQILARMLDNEASVRGHFAGRLARLAALGTTKFHHYSGSLPDPFVEREWRQAARSATKMGSNRKDVPSEFDPMFYLLFNPDLLRFDCNPFDHYLASGRREQRAYS